MDGKSKIVTCLVLWQFSVEVVCLSQSAQLLYIEPG